MRFDVDRNGSVNEPDFATTLANLQATLPAVYLQTLPPALETQSPPKVKTLNEGFDANGRLEQLLGSPAASGFHGDADRYRFPG